MTKSNRTSHIRLTSHPGSRGGAATRFPLHWGAATAGERGPVVGTSTRASTATASAPMAAPTRSTALWRCRRRFEPDRAAGPDQHIAVVDVGPFPQWSEPGRIVSLDPWGHRVAADFAQEIGEGVDTGRASPSPRRG